ncbi:MAG TPA: hypothetical protein C5S37_07560 [Methanophagales archaeon]|nr:hypothetical protein [Methanophagales archaeon]
MLPLYVDLSGKRIVVFGGGTIAERKLRQILETNVESGEINVEVYSRDFTHWIEETREGGGKYSVSGVICGLRIWKTL